MLSCRLAMEVLFTQIYKLCCLAKQHFIRKNITAFKWLHFCWSRAGKIIRNLEFTAWLTFDTRKALTKPPRFASTGARRIPYLAHRFKSCSACHEIFLPRLSDLLEKIIAQDSLQMNSIGKMIKRESVEKGIQFVAGLFTFHHSYGLMLV